SWALIRPAKNRDALAFAQPRYADSIAVMPIDNFTGRPELDHLGMAITEEIITHLAQLDRLKVISRHSVEALAESGQPARALADSLDVRHIVEGSFQLEEGRLRTTLQHIDASQDDHVWADVHITDFDNVVEAQEAVARFVIERLTTALPHLGVVGPDAEGYAERGPGGEAYQLGQHWLGRRTPEGLRRALGHFTEAVREDPEYAPAHAALSSTLALSLVYRYQIGLDGWEAASQAVEAGRTAVDLDPGLATGYAARGYAGAVFGAPTVEVAADFARAAELAPNAASIPSWSSRVLAMQGRFDEAMAEATRAVDLDPLAAGRHMAVAVLSLFLDDYERAVDAAHRAAELEPELALGNATAARAHLAAGQPGECLGLDLGPHQVLRATCLAEVGRMEEAAGIVDSIRVAVEDGTLDTSVFTEVLYLEDLAVYHAWRGEPAQALRWLESAYEASPTGIEIRVYESALFEALRDRDDLANEARRLQEARWSRLTHSLVASR
ncbi:MAG: hypothetical protein HKO53_02840, partial [Gemmatimonadetes bacterium]|nr:hypothetical protein [Gemmatimonadota bacterium]